jgi:pimeloyl-ACP methyl ester carboxylesterase
MKRRDVLQAAGVALVASTAAAPAVAQSNVTFLVAHGAWSAGWAWKKMHPLMSSAGHRLITPTYTGLGDREHLASPSNDLETHIEDVLAVIKYEDLRNVVLIGHSYGGMVATGVADRARERITQLISRCLRAKKRPVAARSASTAGAAADTGTREGRRRLARAAESDSARHFGSGCQMDR